ncbi:MAG: hypothetical protein LLG45_03920 [Actinomycetia bacterium]|nr:hypothetical protein [Actinomycetes bacterium]
MDDPHLHDDDPSYRMFRQRNPSYGLTLPLVVLLIVVAVVSGLVFSGVIQGDESRVGPERTPTTQSTVLIVP